MALLLLFPAAAEDTAKSVMAAEGKFIQYLAGIELLEHSKGESGAVLARRYGELCSITGFAADSAAHRVMQFKNRPTLWQNVRSKVLELVQSLQ